MQNERINVKELRQKFRLSQKDLSDATGIPKGRINGWEQLGSHPKIKDYNTLKNFFASLEPKPAEQPKSDSGDQTDILKEQIALLRASLEDKMQIIALLNEKVKMLEKAQR